MYVECIFKWDILEHYYWNQGNIFNFTGGLDFCENTTFNIYNFT